MALRDSQATLNNASGYQAISDPQP